MCDCLGPCQVAAGPTLFANFLRAQLAFFVAVRVLLASACAADGLLVFKSRFDGFEPEAALRAREAVSSTLVLVQLRPLELQMALNAALRARIRDDTPRADATLRARQAHIFALALVCIVQHILVELVSLQSSVAGVAAPRFSVPLALEALFCLAIEGPCISHFSARGAGMAGSAA